MPTCPSCGDEIAFWALGEIVKEECGILESDSTDEVEAKLERALPADDRDRTWLRAACKCRVLGLVRSIVSCEAADRGAWPGAGLLT